MSIVEIKNLSYNYPGMERKTLDNINLDIKASEFIVLTGPSGCGKTTLCRCFNGLIPHFYGGDLSGEMKVFGISIKDTPTCELARNVGLVFQNPENQLFSLNVERDIAFGLENLAIPREIIRENIDWAMNLTGIIDLKEKAPDELSGGQQQRVAIASILAMKPKIIVLDEPTSFLDPVAAKNLFDVVKKINLELGLTVIVVEHRLDLLSSYADRIILMKEGKIISDGSPRKVLGSVEAFSVGIGIPKIIRLYKELKSSFKLEDIPISIEEFANDLRKMIKIDKC